MRNCIQWDMPGRGCSHTAHAFISLQYLRSHTLVEDTKSSFPGAMVKATFPQCCPATAQQTRFPPIKVVVGIELSHDKLQKPHAEPHKLPVKHE